ncbi:MAG: hypothetical protein JSR45_03495 [Proteobacteria bacterium]|nr:hypothetical protein [Pseudomonadota bacterium]
MSSGLIVSLLRVVLLLAAGGALLALSVGLQHITPPIAAQVEAYTELQKSAVDKLESLSDKGLAIALAMIGVMGAGLIGFRKDMELSAHMRLGVTLAVFFCIASAISGVAVRLRLMDMTANGMQPFLFHPSIQTPLALQYYCLLLAVAAAGWFVVDNALRNQAPQDNTARSDHADDRPDPKSPEPAVSGGRPGAARAGRKRAGGGPRAKP